MRSQRESAGMDKEVFCAGCGYRDLDLERYRRAFRHTFVANPNGGDSCASCGLDLRDLIHQRAENTFDANPA